MVMIETDTWKIELYTTADISTTPALTYTGCYNISFHSPFLRFFYKTPEGKEVEVMVNTSKYGMVKRTVE